MKFLRYRKHSESEPPIRRGFFIAPLVFLLCFSFALGTSKLNPLYPVIQGQTLDTENRVVPYTSITFKHSDVTLLSDEYGYFSCMTPVLAEDTLIVRRIGFKDRMIPLSTLSGSRTIQMESNTIAMAELNIEASSKPVRSVVMPLLSSYTKSSGSIRSGYNQVLSRIPGMTLKTYGGSAGITTLALDGGPSSHTMVSINGMELTSPQNGESDVSQIPVSYIQKMLYLPSDISQHTTGSGDGIVRLESANLGNYAALSVGSYGQQAADLSLSSRIGGVFTSVQAGQRYDEGNYPVIWNGRSLERANNAFSQKYGAISLLHAISPGLIWKLNLLESHQSRGAAGLIWSPDSLSKRQDQLRLLGTTLVWNRQSGNTDFSLNSRSSLENYRNPQFSIDSQHDLWSLEASIQDRSYLNPHIQLISDLTVREDRISSTDTQDHHSRTLRASFTPLLELARLRFSPSLKYFYSPSRFNRTTGDLQIQSQLRMGPIDQIAISLHEIFRYPSFNDLYWQPGGNPDLQPEETQVITAQLRSIASRVGTLTAQWQLKSSENLIQWVPLSSIWMPQNIRSTSRWSTKVSWEVESVAHNLSLFANMAFIRTHDDLLDKPLRYAPARTAAFGLLWTPHSVEIDLNYRYLGERISMYDFPDDVILPGASTWYTSIAYTHPMKFGSGTISLSIDNLTDLSYETIRGYPEPGRTFSTSLQFNW